MNATISFAVICAIVALASQIYSIFSNHNKNIEDQKREKIELEKNLVKLDMKLDNLTNQMAVLVESDKNTTVELKSINAAIIKFNESLKAAWRKIDDHEERLNNIEKRSDTV